MIVLRSIRTIVGLILACAFAAVLLIAYIPIAWFHFVKQVLRGEAAGIRVKLTT